MGDDLLSIAFNNAQPTPRLAPQQQQQQQQQQQHQVYHQGGSARNTQRAAGISPAVYQQGVEEHARALGIDPGVDDEYLWIAEQSLVAPLGDGWGHLMTEEGHPYFYNEYTGESRWDHPMDDHFRQLFQRRKAEALRASDLASSGMPQTPIAAWGASSSSSSAAAANASSPALSESSVQSQLSHMSQKIDAAFSRASGQENDDALQEAQVSHQRLRADCAELKRKCKRMSSERDIAKELADRLQVELDDEIQRCVDLRQQCAALSTKLSAAGRQAAMLRGEAPSLAEEVTAEIREELDRTSGMLQASQRETAELRERLREADARLNTAGDGATAGVPAPPSREKRQAGDGAAPACQPPAPQSTPPAKGGRRRMRTRARERKRGGRKGSGSSTPSRKAIEDDDDGDDDDDDSRGDDDGNDAGKDDSGEEAHNSWDDSDSEGRRAVVNGGSSVVGTEALEQAHRERDSALCELKQVSAALEERAAAHDALGAEIDRLKSQLAEMTERNAGELTSVRGELRAAEERAAKAEAERSTLEATAKRDGDASAEATRREMTELRAEAVRLRARADGAEAKAAEAERATALAEQSAALADAESKRQEAARNELERSMADASGKADRRLAHAEAAATARKESEDRCKGLQRELKEVTEDGDALKARYDTLKAAHDEDARALADSRRTIADMEDDLKRHVKSGGELEDQLAQATKELAEVKSSSAEMEIQLTSARAGLKTLAVRVQEAEEKAERLQTELDAQGKELSALRAECAAAAEREQRAVREVAEATRAECEAAADERVAAVEEQLERWKGLQAEERAKVKALNARVLELQGNIRVLCRVRPLQQFELDAEGEGALESVVYPDDGKVTYHGNKFEFDKVFVPGTGQPAVFQEVRPAVASALEGFNVCVFAYGQTGSGKTYTMEGPDGDRGVYFRALEELFEMTSTSAETGTATHFFVSMLEVYNEQVKDLLVEPGSHQPDSLDIRVGRGSSVYVEGQVECQVTNLEEVEELMLLGGSNRHVGNNNVNEHSSRSHLVFSVRISTTKTSEEDPSGERGEIVRKGKLNLIDLAGSERLSKTHTSGQRLKEAQNINRSLSALGDVVAALGQKTRHVPYRNSKLTFLLQDSLSSNAKVLMFVNINPVGSSVPESLCSLNFASRCRNVQLGQAKRMKTAANTVRAANALGRK